MLHHLPGDLRRRIVVMFMPSKKLYNEFKQQYVICKWVN